MMLNKNPEFLAFLHLFYQFQQIGDHKVMITFKLSADLDVTKQVVDWSGLDYEDDCDDVEAQLCKSDQNRNQKTNKCITDLTATPLVPWPGEELEVRGFGALSRRWQCRFYNRL